MKKITSFKLIMIIVFGLFTNNLFSQEGPYLSLNLGYAMPASSQNIAGFTNSSSINSEQINLSYGKGLNLGGAFGYMFNKNIGLELGISYLIGASSTAQNILSNRTRNLKTSANMIRFNPTVILATDMDGIKPYAKFGLVIGSGSITGEQTDNFNNGNVDHYKAKINGGMAFGYAASIGAMFDLSDKMSFFGEFTMINMSYAPTKSELTEATSNGVDQLPTMTIKDKQTEYVDSYNPSIPIPSSQPDQALKTRNPFGSFGINLGIRFGF